MSACFRFAGLGNYLEAAAVENVVQERRTSGTRLSGNIDAFRFEEISSMKSSTSLTSLRFSFSSTNPHSSEPFDAFERLRELIAIGLMASNQHSVPSQEGCFTAARFTAEVDRRPFPLQGDSPPGE